MFTKKEKKMAQKSKEVKKEKVACENQECACCGCKSKLKASTIIVGALAVGAVAVWALVANNLIRVPGLSGLTGQEKGKVVASVAGEPVYLSEVETLVSQVPQLAELPFESIYPQLVKDVVAEKVLKKAVDSSDIEKNPLVQQRINAILFEAYLVDKFTKTVTDEELKNIYLEEVKNFPKQEEVRARHILVKTEKEARDILVQLKAGADFKMLANTKSLDAGSDNGGDLGYFRKDMMIPAFTEPVFALKVGEVSAPINTTFGWHIVVVEDRREAAPPSFEEMREFLRKKVFQQKVEELIADEHKRYNAEILVPTLAEEKETTVEEEADMALEPEVLAAEIVKDAETETPAPEAAEAQPVAETVETTPAEAK